MQSNDSSLRPEDSSQSADLAWLAFARNIHHVRVLQLVAVIVPFVGLLTGIVLLWGWGIDWPHLGAFLAMYVVTGLGVTIGYHRLFTHRSFDAPRIVKAALAIMGGMAVEGPLLRWVAQHRCHHQHSDDHGDPHSPHLADGHGTFGKTLRGLWHAHMGWLFTSDPPKLGHYINDLRADRMLRTISRMFPLWAILGLAIPSVLCGLISMSWTGALLGFLWGGLARVFFVHHVTWSINSVCHLWGTRPFETGDHSRNNAIFGVLGLGEGWHNNHHAFPTSARHGLRWWQIDISYWIIRAMAAIGLARNVRLPVPQAIQMKRRKTY